MITSSPSLSTLTPSPAACSLSTNSRMNLRESAALTNGGSASSRNVRSPNSLNPTPRRLRVSIVPLRKRASLGGNSTVSGNSSFCEAALPSDSIRRSICSYSTRSCAACWSSNTIPLSDSSTRYSLPTTPTRRSGTRSSGTGAPGDWPSGAGSDIARGRTS